MADIKPNDKDEFVISDRTYPDRSLEIDLLGRSTARSAIHHAAGTLKVYSTAVNVNLPTSGTETRILLLRNPSGSGKTLRLHSISGLLTNTVSAIAILRAYIGPTITATGTAATIFSNAQGGGAAATAMLAYSGPTATATGSRISGALLLSGTAGGREVTQIFDGSVTLAANHDLLITGQPDGTNRASEITVTWVEE
jgi:hypothetical protein